MLSRSPECRLPELPGPLPPAVGFPTDQGVFISKTDWAQLIAHELGMRQWMAAAAACIELR
jgi:hypothetical protein